jgi:Tfp pilus assembly protein FimT
MPLRERQHGFSTLEMVVVVAIIIIIAGVTLPNMIEAIRGYKLNIAAQALEQQLNRCRQEAVRQNQPVSIKVQAHISQIDLNHVNGYTDDNTTATISDDATVTFTNPADGIVTFTSRGEMLIGVTPSFTVTYSGLKRVVTVDPRGAVTVGPEQAA